MGATPIIAASPSAHSELPPICLATRGTRSTSCATASPCAMWSRSTSIHWVPSRHLVGTRLLDVTRHGVELRPRVALVGADRLEPVGAALEDVGDAAERLDVVDHRRHAEGADQRGEGRLDARLAALALEGLEETG